MTPLTPEERRAIIDAHPAAAPGEIEADIEEYESLIAAVFARDPNDLPGQELTLAGRTDDATAGRLTVLHRKLFGG